VSEWSPARTKRMQRDIHSLTLVATSDAGEDEEGPIPAS